MYFIAEYLYLAFLFKIIITTIITANNNRNDVTMKLIKNAKSKYFFITWLGTETNGPVQIKNIKKENVFSIS